MSRGASRPCVAGNQGSTRRKLVTRTHVCVGIQAGIRAAVVSFLGWAVRRRSDENTSYCGMLCRCAILCHSAAIHSSVEFVRRLRQVRRRSKDMTSQ